MSSAFRVELPAYSHSFEVQVTAASTIRDVKQEIAKVCPGSPSPAGQRLIWRGRFLKDEEKVEDIWKSPDDSRVIHLAVHPSAWTSTPPTLPAAPTIATFASQPTPTPTQPRASAGQSAPSPSWYPPLPQLSNPYLNASPIPPIAYIHHLHNQALAIISAGAIPSPSQPNPTDLEAWRSAAKDFYRVRGWPWPDIYDAPYPSGNTEQGAVYEPVTLEGLPYLKLTTPGATPTPAQLHAIRVLSQTFSILSIPNDLLYYPPVNQYPPPPYATATDVNEHLRRLGLPALRFVHTPGAPPNPNDPNNHNPLAAPGAAGAELRAVPVRALMVPLLMLAFRTLLLLYFFSPSKRPLFGMILSLWILYEAWTAMRLVLHDGNERGADGAANPVAPNAPAGAGQPAAQAAGLAGLNVNGAAPNAAVGRSAAILDRLAVVNIAAEDALLETDAPHPSPNFGLKARMFVLLFFASLYPAAWDRRRTALRRREGRIRTEANARQAALSERSDQAQDGAEVQQEDQRQQRSEEDEARARAREQMVLRHERRPAWLKAYVQRVQYTEWADDP